MNWKLARLDQLPHGLITVKLCELAERCAPKPEWMANAIVIVGNDDRVPGNTGRYDVVNCRLLDFGLVAEE